MDTTNGLDTILHTILNSIKISKLGQKLKKLIFWSVAPLTSYNSKTVSDNWKLIKNTGRDFYEESNKKKSKSDQT